MEYMYSLINEKMDNRPAYGFSSKLRAAVEKDTDTPSPLDYYAERVFSIGSSTSKGFSFGASRRFKKVKKEITPGPGEYSIADDLKKKKKKKRSSSPNPYLANVDDKSLSIWTQEETHEAEKKPKTKRKARKFNSKKGFTFGSRTNEKRMSITPGPGEYNVVSTRKLKKRQLKGFTFGVRLPTLIK